jgi:hypothetical protein
MTYSVRREGEDAHIFHFSTYSETSSIPYEHKNWFGKDSNHRLYGRGHTKETGNRNAIAIYENCYQQFPQYELLHSVTCVQLRLVTILGNCGCVTVASFLGVPSP